MKTEKLYYTKYQCPQTLQVVITAEFAGINLELNEINKKYDPVNLVTKEGVLNRSNSILRYLAAGTILNGSTAQQRNQINSWYQFFNTQFLPLLTELYAQVSGDKQTNEAKYTYCITEINKNLKVLDDSLKFKTFFAGNNITLFDITLACFLDNLFKLVVTEAQRKKFVNLVRWYSYIRQIPLFTKHLEKMILCGKDTFKIEFKTQQKPQAQIETKNDKNKQEKKTQTSQKSTQIKPEQKKKETKPDAKKQTKTQTKEQIQQKQDQKTQSIQINLDTLRKQFQNSENQVEVLNNFLNHFNKKKMSAWKIHYIKKAQEGKNLLETQNLANETLQKIDGIKKDGFGTWGVYGEQGNYEIRGSMIWECTTIHPIWKQNNVLKQHNFSRLAPEKEEDRTIILNYLLEANIAEGLTRQSTKRII